jgi:putative transposase
VRHNPFRHQRRSIRLPGYDYSSPGPYFITICTYRKECLFGNVADDGVVLNDYGEIVRDEWERSAKIRPELDLDAFVVMPNHFHGILHIVGSSNVVGAHGHAPLRHPPLRRPPRSIGSCVARFKGVATRRINAERDAAGKPVWQRNYYEHIVRDEADLARIRDYIATNPLRWPEDEYHPSRSL